MGGGVNAGNERDRSSKCTYIQNNEYKAIRFTIIYVFCFTILVKTNNQKVSVLKNLSDFNQSSQNNTV